MTGSYLNNLKFEFGTVIPSFGSASFARHGVHDVHRAHYLSQSAATQDAAPGRLLATGAALEMAFRPHSGEGAGELGLVRALLEDFAPGDVMLANALYCNYYLIATLMNVGVDVLNCQTPQMNEKQLWAHLRTYNVIRLLTAQAACNVGAVRAS